MNLPNLLRHISAKHVRLQKTQLVMAMAGICLGVAAMVAIDLANRSVLRSFEDSINQVTGRAALTITGTDAGFPEAMLERVQNVAGVEYAVPVIEATASLTGTRQRPLMILGIDVLQDHQIRDYSITDESADIPDPLLFLARSDSILITRAMAAAEGIGIDQEIRVQTVAGLRNFRVRGLLNPTGPARVAGGDIAVMDVFAAQMAFGKEGRIDRIDVSLLPGETLATVRERIREALPAGYSIDTPAGRTQQVEILLGRFSKSMSFISVMALFVGMYLIYNTVSIAVVQRRREIGILRALGAGRGEICRLFLAETLCVATAASLAGAVLGYLFAGATVDLVAQSVTDMYLRSSGAELALSWQGVLGNAAVGVLASLVAATLPALAGARITPAAAIRSQPYSEESGLLGAKIKVAATLCLLAAALLIILFATAAPGAAVRSLGVIVAGALLLLLGISLCTPLLLRRIVPLCHGGLAACCGAQGRLAGLNLQKNVSRNGVAVAAIVCSIALFVSSANAINSVRRSVFDWIDTIIRADILVSSGHPLAGGGAPTIPMPAEMQQELAAVDGVRAVDLFRKTFLDYGGRKVLLEMFDVPLRLEYCPAMITEGSREDMLLLSGKDNITVNEGFAVKHRIRRGDTILLPTPAGPMPFTVTAVVVSYSADTGVIWMDISTYRRHWQDPLIDTYEVLVQPGRDIETVRQAILERFGGERQLFALPAAEFKLEVQKVLDRSFVLTNAVNIITLVIAGLGIIITLLSSVLERTREIGILRGIGMQKNQVSAVVIIESSLIGAAGGILGIGCGALIGWIELEGIFRLDYGESVVYYMHYGAMAWAMLLAVGLSAAAGLYPARRAAATNIVEALTYE
jgi:putative ABC transport system permease protein